MLAGIPVREADVLEHTGSLRGEGFDIVAEKLERAIADEVRILALTVNDRESMIWALAGTNTDGLCELRAVLLREHEWRTREGLA